MCVEKKEALGKGHWGLYTLGGGGGGLVSKCSTSCERSSHGGLSGTREQCIVFTLCNMLRLYEKRRRVKLRGCVSVSVTSIFPVRWRS